MKTIEIENKRGKVKLNEVVTRDAAGKIAEEIGRLFGFSAVASGADFGEITNVIENGVDVLDIEINSPGGSVFDGYTIYQEIKSLQDRGVVVNATITGLAASMASVIAMACDNVAIVPHGRMMIHDASTGVQGNADELRRQADLLDGVSENIAEIYAYRTKKSKEAIRDLMKKETWMNAAQCVAEGFADTIFDIGKKTSKKEPMNLFKNFIQSLSSDEKVQFAAQVAEVESLQSELAEAQAKIEELTNVSAVVLEKEVKIQELSEKNGELEAKVAEVAAEVETLKETISAKEAEIEEVKNSVADKTIEALASIGQSEPLDLDNKGEQKTVLETFESLKGAEATAFYKANRKAILAEQSKK